MSRWRFYTGPIIGLLFIILICIPNVLDGLLRFLFPAAQEWVFPRESLFNLIFEHLVISLSAALIATLIGVFLTLCATRSFGRSFLPLLRDSSSLAQTIPPAAVLALAIPFLGFGYEPVLLALVLYSVLPVINNSIAAIEGLPAPILEAARGLGMSPLQVLFRIELPLALPLIGTGVRISTVINVGTAAIAAFAGAGGLGSPIMAGLIRNNPAWVFQGAIASALLALLLNALLLRFEMILRPAASSLFLDRQSREKNIIVAG